MYNHEEIEKKWREYWEKNETFKTDVWDFSKPKYYALDMFPYPSGVGLHAGHPEGYSCVCPTARQPPGGFSWYRWTTPDGTTA